MHRPISAQPCYSTLQDRTNLHNTSSSKFYQDYSASNCKKITKRPGVNRLTPQIMIHDQESLYSETMNLKRQIHELQDQNVKLKTRLTFFDKENTRLNNYIVSGEQANNTICSKNLMTYSGEKETSSMLINLKKLLKQAKQQIHTLQESNINLKRTVKYTKINELEIQRKALLDQTGRLKAIVDELVNHRSEEISYQSKIEQLTHGLKCLAEENENLLDLKERYEENIMQLQNSLQETEENVKERESKIVKDLKIARQKIQDSMRKQQIYQNYIATLIEEKDSKPNKASLRCSSITKNSLSRSSKVTNNGKQRTSQMRPGTAHIRKSDVTVVRASNFQVKKNSGIDGDKTKLFAASLNPSGFKEIAQSQLLRPHIPAIPLNKEGTSSKAPNNQQSILSQAGKVQNTHQQSKDIVPKTQGIYSKQVNNVKKAKSPSDLSYATMKRPSEQSVSTEVKGNLQRVLETTNKEVVNQSYSKITANNRDVQHINNKIKKSLTNNNEEYGQEFEQEQEDNGQINQYGDDFQVEPIEQTPSGDEQRLTEKQLKKKPQKKKKENKQSSNPIDKVTELISLRLRAQQYPIGQLVSDILASCPGKIDIAQLADLLQKEPFLINQHSVELMLKVLFKVDRLTGNLTINTQLFVDRLAQLIKPCKLFSLEEQELLASQIHETLSQNWQDLILMLERQQSPDGTVSRTILEKCLKTIGLSKQHLDMIISDLSLSCEDLQHIEYINLYEIYFDSRQQPQFNQQQPVEMIQKRDLNHHHTIRQEYEESSMSNDHMARHHHDNANQQIINKSSFSMKGGSADDFASEDLPQGLI